MNDLRHQRYKQALKGDVLIAYLIATAATLAAALIGGGTVAAVQRLSTWRWAVPVTAGALTAAPFLAYTIIMLCGPRIRAARADSRNYSRTIADAEPGVPWGVAKRDDD